jgi:hypothetical protein
VQRQQISQLAFFYSHFPEGGVVLMIVPMKADIMILGNLLNVGSLSVLFCPRLTPGKRKSLAILNDMIR